MTDHYRSPRLPCGDPTGKPSLADSYWPANGDREGCAVVARSGIACGLIMGFALAIGGLSSSFLLFFSILFYFYFSRFLFVISIFPRLVFMSNLVSLFLVRGLLSTWRWGAPWSHWHGVNRSQPVARGGRAASNCPIPPRATHPVTPPHPPSSFAGTGKGGSRPVPLGFATSRPRSLAEPGRPQTA